MHFQPKFLLRLGSLALFASLSTASLFAQNNKYFLPDVFRKPPNTAAFDKYGEYQVNMFSGVPEISIPLYEIKSGGLSVPITLSYHASGIKVSEVSSWVGLGWSLNAGGEISRRVMGLPDDAGTAGYLSGKILEATLANTNDLYDDARTFMAKVKNKEFDMEPDIYNYSYPGGGGKFFFDGRNSNAPIPIPFAPIKINRTGLLNSMSITDANGNRHDFGTTVTSSGTFNYGYISENGVSSWPLEKIISQDVKDTVTLTYTGVWMSMPSDPVETLVLDDNIQTGDNAATCTGFSNNPGATSMGQSGNFVTEQQLNTIFFKNGKIVFKKSTANRLDVTGYTGSQPKSLQSVEVYGLNPSNGTYLLQKTIWFYQTYFFNGVDADSRRLRLDSVGVLNANNQVIQKYRFDYNTLEKLPKYTSYGKDYWGYYNGKDSQTSLIPRQAIEFVWGPRGSASTVMTIGSDTPNGREADTVKMQAAVLQRIYYPTGGYTDFTYQTNRYTEGGITKLAGGLRVLSIKSYDGISPQPIVKTYEYNTARKNFDLGSYTFMTEQNMRYYPSNTNQCSPQHTQDMRRRTYVSVPTTDIEAWDGTPVVYPAVTEYSGDGSVNIGKTVYTFRDHNDAGTSASYYGKPVYVSYFFARGQLSSKSVYKKAAGGLYAIAQRETMTYTAFPETNYAGVGFMVGSYHVNTGGNGDDMTFPVASVTGLDDYGRFKPAFYSIVSDDNYLTSKNVTTYDDTDTTRSISNYTQHQYGSRVHQQISRVTETDSKGKFRTTTNKYAPDYMPGGTGSTGNTVLDNMISRNVMIPVESWDSVRNNALSAGAVTSAIMNLYRNGTGGAVVPDKILKLNIASPLTGFQPAYVASGAISTDTRYTQMIRFDGYDTNNNIAQYTPRNAGPTSIIWDYNNALPVAEVKNATVGESAFTGFETGGTGNWTFSGTGRAPGGITGKQCYNLATGSIAKSGLISSKTYIVSYWTMNSAAYSITGTIAGYPLKGATINGWTRYQHLVTGQTTITVSGTNMIDELCLYPATAQMVTYSYDPLVGQTSMSDVKGYITYYEYDALQRLINVRDQSGNITKSICYNYAGQQSGCGIAPPAPVTPYVKLESTGGYLGTDNHYYGNFTFKVFSDAAFANPYNVTANYNVQYKVTLTTTTNGGSPVTSSSIYTTVIAAGTNSKTIQLDVNTCGQAVIPNVVANKPSEQQAATGGGSTNVLPPGGGGGGGGDTTCTTAAVELVENVNVQ